ncbi:MAG: hypothetical protein ACP6IP_05930 [Candidatus Njordarchaeia archaeon]
MYLSEKIFGFGEESKIVEVITIWYLIDVIIFAILGISEGSFNVFIYLVIWGIIIAAVYRLKPGPYILWAFILSVVEETIAYYLGGGLGGTAKSLVDDYAGSLPVFLMFIVGWYMFMKRYDSRKDLVFLFSGAHGFLIEIVLTGGIFNILVVFALGGAAMFIYSSIITSPGVPKGERDTNVLTYFAWFFLILILMIIGGIIAVSLRAIL